ETREHDSKSAASSEPTDHLDCGWNCGESPQENGQRKRAPGDDKKKQKPSSEREPYAASNDATAPLQCERVVPQGWQGAAHLTPLWSDLELSYKVAEPGQENQESYRFTR